MFFESVYDHASNFDGHTIIVLPSQNTDRQQKMLQRKNIQGFMREEIEQF